ncbi:MAG: AMP-binding protein, partial [bacterium]|nr:AMP-binding protein [bacterium]
MNRHRDKTLTVLFEEQAARTPDRIALIGCSTGHGSYKTYMTYDQLNRKAGQLARLLLDKGVMPGAIIAVKIEKSIEMIAAALGILKAGAAYLPIDPDYPEDRIDYMLADSATELLLTVRDGALILTPTPRRGDPIVPTPNG